jgi:PIN domain nuclease of toxin-antitoxin system
MRLLLDTHTFIWWDSDPTRLSQRVAALCQSSSTTLLLSVASVWEMQIKQQLGRLQLRMPLTGLIAAQQQTNGLEVLPVQLDHVLVLGNLPLHHKDPFDRLLICQSQVEDAILVSADSVFSQYPVTVFW